MIPLRSVNPLISTAVLPGSSLSVNVGLALVTADLRHDIFFPCLLILMGPALDLGEADLEQACEFAGSVGHVGWATLPLTAQC